jgi:hypothetical protein
MSQQLLINPNFDDGTTGWTASGGFGTYSYTSSNQIAVLDGVAYFTYVSRTLSQTASVSEIIGETGGLSAVLNIRHRQKGDDGSYTQVDIYNFEVIFKNSAGATVASKRTPSSGSSNAPQYFTDIELTLSRSEIPETFDSISSVEVRITGLDAGYWNGNHGPMVDYVTLTTSDYSPPSSSSYSSESSSSSSSEEPSSSSSSFPLKAKNKWLGNNQGGHFAITKGIVKRLWPDFFRQNRQRQ